VIKKTPLPVVLCAWVVVAIPLGWGLYQSVVKARPLFAAGSAPTLPAAPAPSTAPSK
jgi:hypothetical protein